MLTLTDIIDITVTNSGEFILGDDLPTLLSTLNMNKNRFWRLIKQSLEYYQKYKPLSKSFNLYVISERYTFTTDVPKWISRVIPIGLTTGVLVSRVLFPEAAGMESRKFLWKYESPNLYLTESGKMDITAMYDYTTVITTGTDGKITEVQINEMSESNDEFFDLVLAHFLIALGRSRRAFTLSDIPIEMDGDTLVSEGTDLLDKTKEELQARSKWWEGIGV